MNKRILAKVIARLPFKAINGCIFPGGTQLVSLYKNRENERSSHLQEQTELNFKVGNMYRGLLLRNVMANLGKVFKMFVVVNT